jgi:hypothetical protein
MEIELNPSGLVRAYEEILFVRFGLTKDHSKLLFLGPGLRDIITSTPSERKTNISKFTPNISEYLELNKTTAKYFSKLKNDISVIVNELHRLGDDKEKIILMRDSSKEKYDSALLRLQHLKNVESSSQKIIDMLSVNGKSITSVYDNTVLEYNLLCSTLTENNTRFTNFCGKYGVSTSLKQNYYVEYAQSIRDEFLQLKFKADSYENRERELLSSKDTIESILNQKKRDYTDYIEKNNPEKFIMQQEALNKEITESESLLASMYDENPSLKEYKDLFTDSDATKYLMFIDTVSDRVHAIQSQFGDNNVFDNYISSNGVLSSQDEERDELKAEYDKICIELQDLEKNISNFNQLKDLSDMLSQIPGNCANKSCTFILKAKEYDDIKTKYPKLLEDIAKLNDIKSNLSYKLNNFDEYVSKSITLVEEMHKLSTYIDSYSETFTKFPDFEYFSDPIKFFKNIMFILPRARKYSEFSYAYKRHKDILLKLLDVKNLIDSSKSYYEYIHKCESEISSFTDQMSSIISEIQHLHNEKIATLSCLDTINVKVNETSSLPLLRESIVVGLQKYSKLKNTITKLRKHYVAGRAFEDKMSRLRSKISSTQSEVLQYEKDLNIAEYNMRTFDEYEKKRDILTCEYGLLETLRKAWSPTTGVPLIFIEGFMNNLLSSANRYLAEIWPDQELFIDGFGIDEKNFFINVKQSGSNIAHDASVCSGAERATLTTVLSLALLKQFPKIADMYNITKFDEIDGTLDYNARKAFIGILNDLLDDIHCEQAFFISHNDTFDSNVDVILLKDSSEYENRILNGAYNVIYR